MSEDKKRAAEILRALLTKSLESVVDNLGESKRPAAVEADLRRKHMAACLPPGRRLLPKTAESQLLGSRAVVCRTGKPAQSGLPITTDLGNRDKNVSAPPPKSPDRKNFLPRLPWKFRMAAGASAVIVFAVAGIALTRPAAQAPTSAAVVAPLVAAEPAKATEEQRAMIDEALVELRQGNSGTALAKLKLLQSENREIPALSYFVALAALQAGDLVSATVAANESIKRGEQVSDALALSAAIEGLKAGNSNWQTMGDPRLRADSLLHEAIDADLANPFPYIELAMRMRSRGENEQAKRLLEAARIRLNPVDCYALLDTTMLLLKLQEVPDADLPQDIDPNRNTASLFGAAYVSMRLGDFARASGLLQTGRTRLPGDLFSYLIGDPELQKFASHPEMAQFFR